MTTNSSRDFWLDRWQRGEIGFHEAKVNDQLMKFWPQLELTNLSKVLVPLCGKSLDMMWLSSQGVDVVGVELSQLAVDTFFQEQSIEPKITEHAGMQIYTGSGITIICGDFFDLPSEQLDGVTAVYDRAALIALPPDVRRRYAKALSDWLPEDSKMLLLTVEYDMNEMQGPPFSVPDAEIEGLYGEHFDITLELEDEQMLDRLPRFRERGLTWMTERVYTLVRRQ